MNVQKNVATRKELHNLLDQLDGEGHVSYEIQKTNEGYIIRASSEKEQSLSVEQVEKTIKAYVQKKNDYGVAFVLQERNEPQSNFVCFDIIMAGTFQLPWGNYYRVGSIECYLAPNKINVEEYKLSLYDDMLPKERLKSLAVSYKLLDARKVGNPPIYHVYSYSVDTLENVFSLLDSLVYP